MTAHKVEQWSPQPLLKGQFKTRTGGYTIVCAEADQLAEVQEAHDESIRMLPPEKDGHIYPRDLAYRKSVLASGGKQYIVRDSKTGCIAAGVLAVMALTRMEYVKAMGVVDTAAMPQDFFDALVMQNGFVSSGYQGNSLLAALFVAVKADAQASGIDAVSFGVNKENASCIKAATVAGYQQVTTARYDKLPVEVLIFHTLTENDAAVAQQLTA